ncbi:MAG: hypothetical protein ABFD83_03955 [Armatimonadota bacterium]
MRVSHLAILVRVLLILAPAHMAEAASPPQPTYGTAVVDGDIYDNSAAQTSATSESPQNGIALELICANASIDVHKSYAWTTGDGLHVGDVVTHTFTVTNTGKVILDSIAMVDDKSGQSQCFLGYLGVSGNLSMAVPAVLAIVPGGNWANYVGAAQDEVEYTLKNVTLQKKTPEILQCTDVFPARTITQQGICNIRLWWPLMYEIPGTTWTLCIRYGTQTPYDDDADGSNPPGCDHSNTWKWTVDTDIYGMIRLLALFHELPFGKEEVPLISDEVLYDILLEKLIQIRDLISVGDTANAGLMLEEFELMVMNACITVLPTRPNSTGFGTGITNSDENPACCKLLADAEYIGEKLGIYIQKK